MKMSSHQAVLDFYRPIEHLFIGVYPTLEETFRDGNFYLGDGKIPTKLYMSGYDVDIVMHEYAHLIEWSMSKNKRRLTKAGFGFHYTLDGWGYDSPTTCQAFEREIRTIAIQYFLFNHFKKELNFTQHKIIKMLMFQVSAICSFLNDAWFFEKDISKTFIDIKSLPYREQKYAFERQVFRRVMLEMGKLSFDEINKHRKSIKHHFKKKMKENKIPLWESCGSGYAQLNDDTANVC